MGNGADSERSAIWIMPRVPDEHPALTGFRQGSLRCIAVVLWCVLLSRASLDNIFSMIPLGSSEMTLGAVENVVVIAAGLLSLMLLPPRLAVLAVLAWAPYLAWLTLTLSWSPDAGEGLRLLLNIFSYAAIFFMGLAVTACQTSLRNLIDAVLLSTIIPLATGILQAVRSHGDRTQGTFPHPNIFAMYLLATICISLWLLGSRLRRSSTRLRVIAAATVLALSLIMMLLTQTRSAWSCTAVIFMLFGILVERRALLVLPLAGLLILLPPVQSRLSDLNGASDVPDYLVTSGQINVDSYAWRKMLWRDSMTDSQDHRVTGEGMGSFRHNSIFFFPVQPGMDSHSVYIQTIYEAGVIGLALLLWIPIVLATAFARAKIERSAAFLPIGLLVAYFMMSYSDNLLFYLSAAWYYWALLGAVLGAVLIERASSDAVPKVLLG